MALDYEILTPPVRLALAYCVVRVRPGFALLLRFDERIAGIALGQGEPMVAQLKLAWWRDALAVEMDKRPRGEPMLAELSQYEREGAYPALADAMGNVLDAWGLLLANETWSHEVLLSYARLRGNAIFGSYLNWTDRPTSDAAGEAWALDDLVNRSGHDVPSPTSGAKRLPRALSILAMAVHQQRAPKRLSGIRLVLHGLTGL